MMPDYAELVSALRNNAYHYGFVGNNGLVHLLTDAADAIDDLQGQLSVCLEGTKVRFVKNDDGTTEVLFENQWIPVTERLPERGERVLVSDEKGFVCEAYLSERKRWTRHRCIVDYITPTHWMPLPEPPKEETE